MRSKWLDLLRLQELNFHDAFLEAQYATQCKTTIARNLRVCALIIFTAFFSSLLPYISSLYVPALQDPEIPINRPKVLVFWANQFILILTICGGILTSPRFVSQFSPVALETCVLGWVILLILCVPWTNWYVTARLFGFETMDVWNQEGMTDSNTCILMVALVMGTSMLFPIRTSRIWLVSVVCLSTYSALVFGLKYWGADVNPGRFLMLVGIFVAAIYGRRTQEKYERQVFVSQAELESEKRAMISLMSMACDAFFWVASDGDTILEESHGDERFRRMLGMRPLAATSPGRTGGLSLSSFLAASEKERLHQIVRSGDNPEELHGLQSPVRLITLTFQPRMGSTTTTTIDLDLLIVRSDLPLQNSSSKGRGYLIGVRHHRDADQEDAPIVWENSLGEPLEEEEGEAASVGCDVLNFVPELNRDVIDDECVIPATGTVELECDPVRWDGNRKVLDLALFRPLSASKQVQAMRSMYNASSWIIEAESSKLMRWTMVVLVATMLTAVATPYELAFLESEWSSTQPLFWVNKLIEGVFVCDIIVNFCTVKIVWNKSRGNYDYFRSPWQIAQQYGRTWLLLDIISIIPWSLLLSGGSLGMQTLRLLRLIRLIKLARVLKLGKTLDKLAHVINVPLQGLDLFKMVGAVLLISHWMACVFGKVSLSEGQQGWVASMVDQGRLQKDGGPLEIYLYALYWAVMTVTSVGYGDIIPSTRAEVITASSLMMIAGVLWAVVTGTIFNIVSNLHTEGDALKRDMDNLNKMITNRHLGDDVAEMLRMSLRKRNCFSSLSHEQELLGRFSPAMQGVVATGRCRDWIPKVPYLMNGSVPFIVELTRHLTSGFFVPQERVGSRARTLFAVERGICILRGVLLVKGGTWGHDFILESQVLRQSEPTISLSFLSVSCLKHDDLVMVLESFPHERHMVRKATVRLAALRGILRIVAKDKRRQEPFSIAHKSQRRPTTNLEKRNIFGHLEMLEQRSDGASCVSSAVKQIGQDLVPAPQTKMKYDHNDQPKSANDQPKSSDPTLAALQSLVNTLAAKLEPKSSDPALVFLQSLLETLAAKLDLQQVDQETSQFSNL